GQADEPDGRGSGPTGHADAGASQDLRDGCARRHRRSSHGHPASGRHSSRSRGSGQRVAEYADGRTEAVSVTEPLVVEIDGRDTLEEALVLGDEVLIGQTVLEKLDLFMDSRRRRLVPNPAHPDQPVTKVKFTATRPAQRVTALLG